MAWGIFNKIKKGASKLWNGLKNTAKKVVGTVASVAQKVKPIAQAALPIAEKFIPGVSKIGNQAFSYIDKADRWLNG